MWVNTEDVEMARRGSHPKCMVKVDSGFSEGLDVTCREGSHWTPQILARPTIKIYWLQGWDGPLGL